MSLGRLTQRQDPVDDGADLTGGDGGPDVGHHAPADLCLLLLRATA